MHQTKLFFILPIEITPNLNSKSQNNEEDSETQCLSKNENRLKKDMTELIESNTQGKNEGVFKINNKKFKLESDKVMELVTLKVENQDDDQIQSMTISNKAKSENGLKESKKSSLNKQSIVVEMSELKQNKHPLNPNKKLAIELKRLDIDDILISNQVKNYKHNQKREKYQNKESTLNRDKEFKIQNENKGKDIKLKKNVHHDRKPFFHKPGMPSFNNPIAPIHEIQDNFHKSCLKKSVQFVISHIFHHYQNSRFDLEINLTFWHFSSIFCVK